MIHEDLNLYPIKCPLICGGILMERRIIYVGKKPLHTYIRAVLMAMQSGELEIDLVARGSNTSRAIDVAELCKRKHGIIAQQLPETVEVTDIQSNSETVTSEQGHERMISVITISIQGSGEFPQSEDS